MNVTLFYVCFALYLMAMLYIGIRQAKNDSAAGYLMGSRSLPMFLVIGTMLATQVGTGSSLGAAGFAYSNGWAGLIYGVGGFLSIVGVVWLFGDIRKYGFATMSEEISFYYGGNKTIKAVVAIVTFFASVGWLGAHLLGGSMYLAGVTGMELPLAKLITLLGFALFVVGGGYMAVVWTDAIQALVLFFGFIGTAIYLLINMDGLGNVLQVMPEGTTSFLGIEGYGLLPTISLIVSLTIGGFAVPSFRQRIYTSKDEKTAKRGFAITAMLYLIFAAFPVIIGMCARAINPDLGNNNFAIPFLALNVLPTAFGIIIMISGLSATMSSASSDALTGTTVLINDIYPVFKKGKISDEKLVFVSRIGGILTMLVAFIMALTAVDITNYISNMISTTLTGLAVASVMGRYWKRATWQGGIAALVGGSVFSIVAGKIPAVMAVLGDPTLVALAGSILCCFVVSLCTPANHLSEEEALAIVRESNLV